MPTESSNKDFPVHMAKCDEMNRKDISIWFSIVGNKCLEREETKLLITALAKNQRLIFKSNIVFVVRKHEYTEFY